MGKMNSLTPEETRIIQHKGTEAPFSGKYDNFYINGIYLCKQCNGILYRSMDKFHSGCGWPSFDDEIPGAIKKLTDADGRRTEILCQYCDGHLGHVFHGEKKTKKNTRHCVNSLSIKFIGFENLLKTPEQYNLEKIIVAGGCFWGIEYFYESEPGVFATACGYIGGDTENPTYRQVCTGNTGHAEAVAVIYSPKNTHLNKLLDLFFDMHNPMEKNKQGVDIGTQYRSAIFPRNLDQEDMIKKYIAQYNLKNNTTIVTTVEHSTEFWIAEDYHQKYFSSKNQAPTCHYKRSNNT